MTNDPLDDTLTALAHGQMPFTRELGIGIVGGDATTIRARCSWSPERCTSADVLHGGYLMAVADSVGAMLAVFNLPEGAITATIESKTNFIRGVTGAIDLDVTTTLVHAGRTAIVVQTDITRSDGKLVTRTTQTQAVIGPS